MTTATKPTTKPSQETPAPPLELKVQNASAGAVRRTCKYCIRQANRAGGLCHRHHKMWVQGNPNIVPMESTGRRKNPRKCEDCEEDAEVKGRCRRHYGQWRRDRNRPKCTLPYCEVPRDKGNNLYCRAHSVCIAPGCDKRFKARRLCASHYTKLFLLPRNREEAERIKNETATQPALSGEWEIPGNTAPEVEEAANPYLVGPEAPPLHAQAGCDPSLSQDMEECIEALTMLQARGILPETVSLRAKAKAGRIVHTRVAGTAVQQRREPAATPV